MHVVTQTIPLYFFLAAKGMINHVAGIATVI